MTDTSDRKIIWEGPHERVLLATVEPDASRVEVYVFDGIDHASQSVPVRDFQIWASTVLAEISLIERRTAPMSDEKLRAWLDDCDEFITAEDLREDSIKFLQARLKRAVAELRARL